MRRVRTSTIRSYLIRLDALEPHLIKHVCIKNSWDSIEKPPFGRGWVAADDEWRRFIRAAHGIRDKHKKIIVWIAHTAIERIDDPRVPTYTSYQPKLHKRARVGNGRGERGVLPFSRPSDHHR